MVNKERGVVKKDGQVYLVFSRNREGLSGAAARTGNMKKQDRKKYYKNRMMVVV